MMIDIVLEKYNNKKDINVFNILYYGEQRGD